MQINRSLLVDLSNAIESGESVWETVIPNDTFRGTFKGLFYTFIVSDYGDDEDELDIIAVKDNLTVGSLTADKANSKRTYMENILHAIKSQIFRNRHPIN